MKLFKVISLHDDAIARRYNGLGGSRWVMTVAQLFAEKIITQNDINDFSDKTKQVIYLWAR
ncbi:hypothetical protein [Terrimonas alba]|uniref:hypothetical protein n=1 Tax=Terrimonas alba TaxID=3349636 RepID=UPI0035F3BA00